MVSNVESYRKQGILCLVQISSFLRKQGPQVSATQRLSERMRAGGQWQTISLTRTIEGCDIAAAWTRDGHDTTWNHVYLVWDWLAVHVTVSRRGESRKCDLAWDCLFSI